MPYKTGYSMNKIPNNIKILGARYKVIKVSGLREDEERWGDVCVATQTIRIDPALSEYMQAQTLLHESLHGIAHMTGELRLYHNERLIDLLATSILTLMRDNPQLRKLIGGDI